MACKSPPTFSGSGAQKEAAHKRDQDTLGAIMTYIKDTFVRGTSIRFLYQNAFIREFLMGVFGLCDGSELKMD